MITDKAKIKTRGDRIALSILFLFFAFSAFAMNPPNWGWFDTLAVCAFTLFGVWHLARAFVLNE